MFSSKKRRIYLTYKKRRCLNLGIWWTTWLPSALWNNAEGSHVVHHMPKFKTGFLLSNLTALPTSPISSPPLVSQRMIQNQTRTVSQRQHTFLQSCALASTAVYWRRVRGQNVSALNRVGKRVMNINPDIFAVTAVVTFINRKWSLRCLYWLRLMSRTFCVAGWIFTA